MVFDKKKQESAAYVGFPAWFSDVKNVEPRLFAYAPAHVDVEILMNISQVALITASFR